MLIVHLLALKMYYIAKRIAFQLHATVGEHHRNIVPYKITNSPKCTSRSPGIQLS